MAGRFTALIDRVDVVEEPYDSEDILQKGLSILKSRISLMGPSTHAEYTLRVTQDGNSTLVKKRFSEFVTLHEFLKSRFGPNLPMDLPSKTPMRYFSSDKLDDRKNSLNAYLKELCSRPDFVDLLEVRRFFNCQASPLAVNSGAFGGPGAPSGYSAAGVPNRAEPRPVGPGVRPVVVGSAPGKQRARHDSDDDLVGWDS
ncbi:unnamed protein product [Polarella glacialis]|uniref:PX domain-containing protein n=1 Tax=Polarella glacialis TaxID=89957 RepID=A0A813GWK8_POLGL|nr:unnamed protein product [Polarella glacialis]